MIAFYVRLIRSRCGRLRAKFCDVRRCSGSRRQAASFILKFIRRRSGYLFAQVFARHARRPAEFSIRTTPDTGIARIALKISGGLGDYIIAALYVRDLLANVEPVSFDVFCNDSNRAEWVFASLGGFGGAYTEFLFDDLRNDYDLALSINHFILAYSKRGGLKKLRRTPLLLRVAENVIRFKPNLAPLIREDPTFDNFVARRVVYMNFARATFLQKMSGIERGDGLLELPADVSLMESLGLATGSYITIHNGFNPDAVALSSGSTKTYPHFDAVVRLIKEKRPDLSIIQLGTTTSIPIRGVDHDLVGKTTLQQVAALLRHAAWHVDNESGLVHLAHCLGTRSTVVFGPTPIDYFGYQDNSNIPAAACGGCWWITETWMSHCPRGLAAPICMNQDPMVVANAVLTALPRQNQILELSSLRRRGVAAR